MSVQLASWEVRYGSGTCERMNSDTQANFSLSGCESEGWYSQNSDVLKSSKVTLGDACEVIPIQLPVEKKHTKNT